MVRLTEPGQHGAVLGMRMSANLLAQAQSQESTEDGPTTPSAPVAWLG